MRHQAIAKRTFVVILALATTVLLAVPAFGGGRPLSTELAGTNEVPPSGSPAVGTAHLTLNQGQGEICVEIESSGYVTDVIAAHIHQAVAGVNGGVVVPLTISSSGQVSNCEDVEKDLIKAIRQNPQGYYINIHTSAIPTGAIRGQLSK